ncbi:MAG: hypothetical protein PUP92_09200 [Rhizonema sp. PD38]|nr:hypothetical protein [Rhizonema sp. PD38]
MNPSILRIWDDPQRGHSIQPIGNHTISFGERGFHEIANEIVGRLMSVRYDVFSQQIHFAYVNGGRV